MQMRNAGTGPQAAPTPVEAYAWRSRHAARKAKCIISRSISPLGIEGSSSARTMRKHRTRPASQLSGHEQATATAEFSHLIDSGWIHNGSRAEFTPGLMSIPKRVLEGGRPRLPI